MKNLLSRAIPVIIVLELSILILAIVNFRTGQLVAQTNEIINRQNLKAVLDAEEFVPVIPETLWQAYDSLKDLKGIVFKVRARGYAGFIPITVGVGIDGKITRIVIGGKDEGFKETQGYGSKVKEQAFTQQFSGKTILMIALKIDGGEIDAITGATISSRAVCNGIKRGLEFYDSYLTGCSPDDPRCAIFANARNFSEIIKDTLWYALSYPETLGVVFVGQTSGYLDIIKYIAGLTKGGTLEKIVITYSHETEGIGEQIRNQEFLDKFRIGIPDVITGATISSGALIKSVQANVERFKVYLK